jgi:putative membrane protein
MLTDGEEEKEGKDDQGSNDNSFFNGKRLKLFLKGMAMGAADTVPGVSGGTIAFITNIYEELIFSIRACNLNAFQILFNNGVSAAWKHINGNFLLTLFIGIISSAILFANIVGFLLENYEVYVMSFFLGLILASSLYIWKQIHVRGWLSYLLFFSGILIAILLNFIPQGQSQSSLFYIFFSGAVAICAMILPGISGAFILLLLGAYDNVLEAVRTIDLKILFSFVAGCIAGLISFSNLLAYLIGYWRQQTLTFLLGVLLGSLYTIWPSQLSTEEFISPVLGVSTLLAAIGFSLVYIIERR